MVNMLGVNKISGKFPKLIAIDPGANGGIAFYCPGMPKIYLMPIEDSEKKIVKQFELIREMMGTFSPTVIIEHVGGYIGVPQPGSRMFSFGQNVGFLRGCCRMIGWKVVSVMPHIWQKGVECGEKGAFAKQSDWKRHLKEIAEEYQDEVMGKITLKTADALLIMKYAMLFPDKMVDDEEKIVADIKPTVVQKSSKSKKPKAIVGTNVLSKMKKC